METRRTRAYASPTPPPPGGTAGPAPATSAHASPTPPPPGGAAGLALVLSLAVVLVGQAPRAGVAAAQPAGDQRECLALAAYWEAGGEGREGMTAVASVVLNRRAHGDFPSTVCEVVHQGGVEPGCQFRFWCDGESDRPSNADLWAQALDVATDALEGRGADPTGGALFFHAADLGAAPWRVPRERTVRIGRHIYYR